MKFVIIGCGQFGRILAINLARRGYEVTVLDESSAVISEIQDEVTCALIGDAADRRVLERMELVGSDIYVIVAVGEDYARDILIAAQLKEIGVRHLYVRYINELQGKILEQIGIKDLFRVERVAAEQMASSFIHEGLIQLHKIDANHDLGYVRLPDSWIGRRLCDVELRSKFHLNLVTIRRGEAPSGDDSEDVLEPSDQPVIGTPEPNLVFVKGDVLVLFGKESDLKNFADYYRP